MAETEKQRIDRELIELLNEVRVALPGVQVLFAFLLLLPFQQTFRETEADAERAIYLVALLASLAASVLLIAPSTYHRIRFRDRDKLALLLFANRLVLAASACLGLSLGSVSYLVTEMLYGGAVAVIVAVAVGIFTVMFWYAIPLMRRTGDRALISDARETDGPGGSDA